MSNSSIVEWINHDAYTKAKFSEYAFRTAFIDVVLIVDEKKIFAHKIILASACKYFEVSFNSLFLMRLKMQLTVLTLKDIFMLHNDHEIQHVLLQNVDFDDFCLVLEYIYRGVVEIPNDRLQSFNAIALQMQLVNFSPKLGCLLTIIKLDHNYCCSVQKEPNCNKENDEPKSKKSKK